MQGNIFYKYNCTINILKTFFYIFSILLFYLQKLSLAVLQHNYPAIVKIFYCLCHIFNIPCACTFIG